MKKVYLIRHAQSQGNADGRIQGWLDSPLNEVGRQQAHLLARRLATEADFQAIFASPLQRAAETAQIIAAYLNCPLNFDDSLREYNMGPITGLTLAEIKERFPERYLAFKNNQPAPHLPGEEGEEAFMERVHLGMERILSQITGGQPALIVTHSGTINACLRNWLHLNDQRRRPFKLDNASITIVEINAASRRLITLNDTSHLAGLAFAGEVQE
uniref:Phosphoglycerate mutase n=1 Tax=uncultured Chloroflexota bacterium TaxID=166587 RepID=H5SPD4_9CHLR|nr:phosphoglycerate mutase [uncultured Chloroflexota bacterium]